VVVRSEGASRRAVSASPQSGPEKIAAAKPHFPEEDIEALLPQIEEVLRSGWLILGRHTQAFENSFAEYVGTRHAVAVSSCTAALQIVLRYYRVNGREVVLPTNNFVGVVSAVLYEGGTPILTDMDPETFCLDVEDAISRISPNTAGIIDVHIAGLVDPQVDALREICREKGLFLIEDASHAHGASLDQRKAGSIGDVGCFSFYPTKILTTTTGGMITTNDTDLAAFARSVRHHGVGRGLEDVVNLGNDWCMSEIDALLGLQQLQRLDENVRHRNELVTVYRKELADEDWVSIPEYPERFRHAYYKFPVLLREGLDRDRYRRMLNEDFRVENGGIYTPPCHRQPIVRELLRFRDDEFPRAEATLKRQICPPMHSGLTEADVLRAAEAMKEAATLCGFRDA
jgi:perosamine synthetase